MRTAPCFHAYRTCGPTPPTTIVRYAYTQVRCLVAGPNPNPNPNPNPDPNLTQVRYAWWRGDVRGFDAETGLVKVRRPRLTSPRLASPRLASPHHTLPTQGEVPRVRGRRRGRVETSHAAASLRGAAP
jgi:hypothetical protein